MKSPIKFENDFHELSTVDKVTLAVVLALVTLVLISCAAQGFADAENRTKYVIHPGSSSGDKAPVVTPFRV